MSLLEQTIGLPDCGPIVLSNIMPLQPRHVLLVLHPIPATILVAILSSGSRLTMATRPENTSTMAIQATTATTPSYPLGDSIPRHAPGKDADASIG